MALQPYTEPLITIAVVCIGLVAADILLNDANILRELNDGFARTGMWIGRQIGRIVD